MTPPLTDEEAREMRGRLAAHDAAQVEAAKAANRALLEPLTTIGLGGAGPLTCSLEQAIEAIKANAVPLAAVDPGFTSYAFTVASVVEGLDRKLRTMVAQNAPTPAPEA